MARPGQRRIQGALFSFLTIFFAGIAAAALTLWMAGLAMRTFRAAREEMTR